MSSHYVGLISTIFAVLSDSTMLANSGRAVLAVGLFWGKKKKNGFFGGKRGNAC